MRITLLALSLIALNTAHASYYATHCSNSTGSVRWETGHNSNTMFIKHYDNEGEVTKKVPFSNVEVKIEKEVVLKEERERRCGYAGYTKVYAGKAIITPAVDYPEALDFLGERKKLETEVICTHQMNGRSSCQN